MVKRCPVVGVPCAYVDTCDVVLDLLFGLSFPSECPRGFKVVRKK